MIVSVPADVSLIVTEQEPELIVQVTDENLAVELVDEKSTVPVGDTPLTETEQLAEAPAATGLGEQLTVVEVGDLATATANVPELPRLFWSPLYEAVTFTPVEGVVGV